MNLHYDVVGIDGGHALVLLHGFLSSNAQWLPNIEALGASHRLIMAELWGHGESPLPDWGGFTLERYDEELERIRQASGVERWGIIGQSYAAALAIRYAINHPQNTSGVVVTNSRSAFGDLAESGRRHRPAGSGEMPPDTKGNRHLPIHPIHATRLPAGIREKLVAAADRLSPVAIERGGSLAARLNVMEILDQVSVPVLLTNGIFEKSFQASAETIRRRFPHVDVIDLEGGHAVNIDAAAGFNTAVLDFFEGIQGN